MALVFGQLIYTSFPKTGFQLLASQEIPQDIEQFFLEKIVYRHWDVYHPPAPGYKAVYLEQPEKRQSLFGWLYNRGRDDLGRSDIPYFLCYYLEELLEPTHLNYIFNCLQKGPLSVIDCQNFAPSVLESIEIANLWNYQPAAEGVEIDLDLQKQIHLSLRQNQLLNLFVSQREQEKINDGTDNTLQYFSNILIPNNLLDRQVDTSQTDAILQELVSQNRAIKGAAFVSPEGQLLGKAIDLDRTNATAIAGIMLYLAESACDEFDDNLIATISIQSSGGETLSLLACNSQIFLMIKTLGSIDDSLKKKINSLCSKTTI